MQIKKKVISIILVLIYFSFMGIILPYLLIRFELSQSIYDWNEKIGIKGVFFFLFLMSSFVFFPFIYSTLMEEKLSFSIKKKKKETKNPRYYSTVLLIFGIPIMIWLIIGIVGYYSVSEFSGGFGEFVFNGFLVMLIMLIYFCIIPAILLSLKKGRKNI
ncbi:MAG: hypothetical protein ACFFFT_03525 [Candidatus Thorarchaeota archaeon]